MARVTFERVAKRFGAATALEALDLDIADGEFVSLLGPSGCGKTTALRILAGLAEPTGGRVLLDGRDMAGVPPERRNIGMVFQDYALFPHMTVAENIAFGLRERRQPRRARAARVAELLDLVKLGDFGARYPAQLSGGQQQRVALARALAVVPGVLLMDEPLGALDLKLRESMQTEIQRIQRALKVTTLYVTHDQGEAIALSDRMAVMRAGQVVQLGTPEAIYVRPRTRFVAEFVGRINLATARLVGSDGARLSLELAGASIGAMTMDADHPSTPGASVTIAVRPEALSIAAGDATGAAAGFNVVPGRLTERNFAGSAVRLSVDVGAETPWLIDIAVGGVLPPIGAALCVSWPMAATTALFED
ncbi:MAG TPA: ABC transporter ATP-binding protein [Candidatus Sulfotelmatobacter sp.]|nr:ABC transporter ATP-binding protein [Candidatus Sulfotelmatobacter sp.]